jgi:hypothetical protein
MKVLQQGHGRRGTGGGGRESTCVRGFSGFFEEGGDVFRSCLRRLAALLAAGLLALAAMPAAAAVQITFYSHELGSSFPHAFVVMQGRLDRDGTGIEEDYGFTAKSISPAILMGSVKGEVVTDNTASYTAHSDRHFTLTISDAEYDRVIATVERWRTMAQPSYDLGTRNCIHFVAQIAASIGMKADTPKRLMRRPRSYLEYLTDANRVWLQARNAVFHRVQGPAAQRASAG